MHTPTPRVGRIGRLLTSVVLGAAVIGACSDQQPVGVREPATIIPAVKRALQVFDCTGSITGGVSCKPAGGSAGQAAGVLIGGQNAFVKLTSSNVSYDPGTEIYQFDVTVQNLMNEAIGTPDGTVPDPDGIQVFFNQGPTLTGGAGSVEVANADGVGTFNTGNQPFFAYNQILVKDHVSAAKTWQLSMPETVVSFSFQLLVETDIQYLLVINEVLVNPANFVTNPDPNAEWFEVYNAGSYPVQMQGLVIADSAASGRRPFHLIASSLTVQPGGYVVLGNTTNTTSNGGVPVDYAYGSALFLQNSLDALKISRVYGPDGNDTLTIDRTQFASAAVSAKDGVGRELLNPALDNTNMDGSNWADAAVTAVYGPGGRGTPKAQNSTYTP
jgi:hypothetical protein